MSINIHDCEFITSAVKSNQYPVHPYPEIALVGRSNVGKSSLINALVNRKKLARVSGQPGRTQTLNFYRVDRLVLVVRLRLCGMSESVRAQWKPMIEGYLTERENLVAILMIVDIRHRPTADDQMMAEWIAAMDIPAWVVATKADKISRGKYKQHMNRIISALHLQGLIFYAATKTGREYLIAVLNQFM